MTKYTSLKDNSFYKNYLNKGLLENNIARIFKNTVQNLSRKLMSLRINMFKFFVIYGKLVNKLFFNTKYFEWLVNHFIIHHKNHFIN
jgi:hypothetical protein